MSNAVIEVQLPDEPNEQLAAMELMVRALEATLREGGLDPEADAEFLALREHVRREWLECRRAFH